MKRTGRASKNRIEKRERHTDNVDRLELVMWLITKQDQLRASNLNRAAVVVTGSSLVMTAYTFLLGKLWPAFVCIRVGSLEFYISKVPLSIGVIATAIALFYSLNGIVHLGRRSRRFLDAGVPQRLFSHSGETINKFKTFNEFVESYSSFKASAFQEVLLADLWSIHMQLKKRYNCVRRGAQCLFVATTLLVYQVLKAIFFL